MRTDPTGRLDILLGGIIARIAEQNPVLHALYLAFEPDVKRVVKQFDSPAVRRVVRGMVNADAGAGAGAGARTRKRKPKRVRTGVVKAKVIPESDSGTGVVKAKVIPASDSGTVIDAQWVAE